jgi:hypothetical protein
MLASGHLGHHNGLPASIVVSVSLAELESGTGNAHTGGSWLPIKDVIRLASHAHHYLRIYDGAKELALYHTKRLASPGQRIVLYARDREGNAPLLPRSCRRMIRGCLKTMMTTTRNTSSDWSTRPRRSPNGNVIASPPRSQTFPIPTTRPKLRARFATRSYPGTGNLRAVQQAVAEATRDVRGGN